LTRVHPANRVAREGGERQQYLRAVQDALAGAEAARVVLEGVVKRLKTG
jgi:hypothetical protein